MNKKEDKTEYKITMWPSEVESCYDGKIRTQPISYTSIPSVFETMHITISPPRFKISQKVIEKDTQEIFTIYDACWSQRYNQWTYYLDMGSFVSEYFRTDKDLEAVDEK